MKRPIALSSPEIEMNKSSEKIGALEKVAKKWSDSGISWAVANGLEDYPDGIGRDLDVLIERGMLREAVQVVIDVLVPMNWIVLPNLQGWIWWVVAFRRREDGAIDSLQIDLFEHLQWAFTWVVADVAADGPLEQRGPFFEDPGAAVAKRFLLNGLSSGIKTFEKKPHYLEFTKSELRVLPQALIRISGQDWPDLRRAAVEGDMQVLERELGTLKKATYRRAVFSSEKLARLASAFQKQWVVNLAPEQGAPVIGIRINDESRVEDVVQMLVQGLESLVFHRIEVISGKEDRKSSRDLKRLSCLQVVLIFLDSSIPTGMVPDLVVTGKSEREIVTLSSEGDQETISQSTLIKSLRLSLLKFFEIKSSHLFQRHRFTDPKS